MLPMKNHLVIKEPHALPGDNLFPESFMLKELQEIETYRVFDEGNVVGLFPILKIGQIIDKTGIFHVSSLSQEMQIVWVGQTLDKLQLYLEPKFGLVGFCVVITFCV